MADQDDFDYDLGLAAEDDALDDGGWADPWGCVGCGVDTAREACELHHEVRTAAGLGPDDDDMTLCIGCIEQRIGRQLTPEDFMPTLLNETRNYGLASERLMDRLGGHSVLSRALDDAADSDEDRIIFEAWEDWYWSEYPEWAMISRCRGCTPAYAYDGYPEMGPTR